MGVKLSDLPTKAQAQVRQKLAAQGTVEHAADPAKTAARGGGLGKLSHLEMHFDAVLRTLAPDLPAPVPEHPFAKALGRKYRFDRCWLAQKVAVELDGGVKSNGRHVRPVGFTEDCEKLNLAALLGWRVLRFTSEMLLRDPRKCLEQVRGLLRDECH